jgi:hypothetical protein
VGERPPVFTRCDSHVQKPAGGASISDRFATGVQGERVSFGAYRIPRKW